MAVRPLAVTETSVPDAKVLKASNGHILWTIACVVEIAGETICLSDLFFLQKLFV